MKEPPAPLSSPEEPGAQGRREKCPKRLSGRAGLKLRASFRQPGSLSGWHLSELQEAHSYLETKAAYSPQSTRLTEQTLSAISFSNPSYVLPDLSQTQDRGTDSGLLVGHQLIHLLSPGIHSKGIRHGTCSLSAVPREGPLVYSAPVAAGSLQL